MLLVPSEEVRDQVLKPLKYSAQVGTSVGLLGFTGGSVYGLFRHPHPYAFGGAVGVSGFYYGSSIMFMRALFLEAVPVAEQGKRSTQYVASAVAGAVSGAIAGLWQQAPFRRSSAVLGIMSITSQFGYNAFYDHYAQAPDNSTVLERMAKSPWMPLRAISDDEYEDMLNGKIGKLDNDIAVLDSQLAALRQQRDLASKGP